MRISTLAMNAIIVLVLLGDALLMTGCATVDFLAACAKRSMGCQ